MHYSGILVLADPVELGACARALAALPGVEVHYSEPRSGRLLVVQETASVEAQQEGLRRIQALPGVRLAALVEHRVALASVSDDGPRAPDPEPTSKEGMS